MWIQVKSNVSGPVLLHFQLQERNLNAVSLREEVDKKPQRERRLVLLMYGRPSTPVT
jgi:hypothetical protein